MRFHHTFAALMSIGWLCGCAGSVFQPQGLTIEELENGKVHAQKLKSTNQLDNYTLTYLVKVPLQRAWDPSVGFLEWLETTEYVTSIEEVTGDGSASDEDTRATRYRVRLHGSNVPREFDVLRSDVQNEIDIRLVPGEDQSRLNHCSLSMRPFLDGSTLVVAKLQVRSELLTDLLSIPLALIGPTVDAKVRRFGEEMARAHRDAVQRPPPPPPSQRVHIIAIGVNQLKNAQVLLELRLSALNCAVNDAEAFYNWADAAFPAPDDGGPLIRKLLRAEDADTDTIRSVLNQIAGKDDSDLVRPNDTIVFFLAGQVMSRRDGGRKAKPHFLCWDADPRKADIRTIECLEILDAIRQSQASRCLFFCDACFTGGSRGFAVGDLERTSGAVELAPADDTIGPTTALFAAEMKHQGAAEGKNRHGVFTYFLLEKLKEINLSAGTEVSLTELRDHIREGVSKVTDGLQEPFFKIPASLTECRIKAGQIR